MAECNDPPKGLIFSEKTPSGAHERPFDGWRSHARMGSGDYVSCVKDVIGWAASIVLLVTVVAQIVKQWKSRSSRGVSAWLFVGEIVSALLFLWYAITIHNAVYTTTNTLMVVASLVGLGILVWHRRRCRVTSK